MQKQQTSIDFDELSDQGLEPCRDEHCPVIGLHANHKVLRGRGRTCSSCPNCFKPVKSVSRTLIVCAACGWSRERKAPKIKAV